MQPWGTPSGHVVDIHVGMVGWMDEISVSQHSSCWNTVLHLPCFPDETLLIKTNASSSGFSISIRCGDRQETSKHAVFS